MKLKKQRIWGTYEPNYLLVDLGEYYRLTVDKRVSIFDEEPRKLLEEGELFYNVTRDILLSAGATEDEPVLMQFVDDYAAINGLEVFYMEEPLHLTNYKFQAIAQVLPYGETRMLLNDLFTPFLTSNILETVYSLLILHGEENFSSNYHRLRELILAVVSTNTSQIKLSVVRDESNVNYILRDITEPISDDPRHTYSLSVEDHSVIEDTGADCMGVIQDYIQSHWLENDDYDSHSYLSIHTPDGNYSIKVKEHKVSSSISDGKSDNTYRLELVDWDI